MIKSIYIDNFKALNDFKLEFEQLTLLIGTNGVGKSTVLQALELLSYFTKGKEHGELNNYLKENNWVAKDLKSTLNNRRKTKFILVIQINNELFDWSVTIEAKKGKIELIQETITNKKGHHFLLRSNQKAFANNKNGIKLPLIGNSFISSGLSLLDEEAHQEQYPELIAIKKALNGIGLFDFSSTFQLKSSHSISANAKIGKHGENFATYLYQLPKEELEKLSDEIGKYLPHYEKIRITKKSREEVQIDIKEKYNNSLIDAPHISDGTMRIIAILTLALTNSGYSSMLIEEIEDGIHPSLAGEIIQVFLKIVKNTKQQFILTTHNPLILDWVPVKNIHFLYRNSDGQVKQKSFEDSSKVLEHLDYMNPGEIWINFEEKELIEE